MAVILHLCSGQVCSAIQMNASGAARHGIAVSSSRSNRYPNTCSNSRGGGGGDGDVAVVIVVEVGVGREAKARVEEAVMVAAAVARAALVLAGVLGAEAAGAASPLVQT